MRNKFLSCFDAKVLGIYPRAKVAEKKHMQIRTIVQKDHWL